MKNSEIRKCVERGYDYMITGNMRNIENEVDFSHLDITFLSKPIIFGGTAMEYYGIRKRGLDIDFIITK